MVTDFPDEGDVDYKYGGDGKRRERDEEDGTDITWYNWSAGYTVINEEADGAGLGDGALTRTYVGSLADIAGSNPATGTARYYTHDHLGSTRGVYDASKNSLGTFEFTPYGMPFAFTGPADMTRLFTGHDLDAITGNYFAPFRYLNPSAGRWMKQDPLGMVNGPNMYTYVGARPIVFVDPDGQFALLGVIAIAAGVGAIVGGVSAGLQYGFTAQNVGLGAAKGAAFGLGALGLGLLIGPMLGGGAIAGISGLAVAPPGVGIAAGFASGGAGAAASAFLDNFNPDAPWNPLTDGLCPF